MPIMTYTLDLTERLKLPRGSRILKIAVTVDLPAGSSSDFHHRIERQEVLATLMYPAKDVDDAIARAEPRPVCPWRYEDPLA